MELLYLTQLGSISNLFPLHLFRINIFIYSFQQNLPDPLFSVECPRAKCASGCWLPRFTWSPTVALRGNVRWVFLLYFLKRCGPPVVFLIFTLHHTVKNYCACSVNSVSLHELSTLVFVDAEEHSVPPLDKEFWSLDIKKHYPVKTTFSTWLHAARWTLSIQWLTFSDKKRFPSL